MISGKEEAIQFTQTVPLLISDFLTPHNFNTRALEACSEFLSNSYTGKTVTPVLTQGFCSVTFFAGEDLIIQFRPPQHRIDLDVALDASHLYPRYAPTMKYVGTTKSEGLLVYEMSRTPGVSLQSFRLAYPQRSQDTSILTKLVKDFANFHITSFNSCSKNTHLKNGRVGESLQERLLLLHQQLPSRFRPITTNLLANFEAIVNLPWVLTHGDLLPGNIMVSHSIGTLSGFVDWAESEFLPFGLSFYGLEEIIGQMSEDGRECRYHPHSDELRRIFWGILEDGVKGFRDNNMREKLEMAREFGVLLWFGIAFDGGQIDRVVQEGNDIIEIVKLDAFLDTQKIQLLEGVKKEPNYLTGQCSAVESKI